MKVLQRYSFFKRHFSRFGLCAITIFLLLTISSTGVVLKLASADIVKNVDKSSISQNKRGERTYQGQLFTGNMLSYHANGNLALFEQFEKGRRQGAAKRWFKDGRLGFKAHYEKGLRKGIVSTWWFNGNKRSETFFKEGKPEGIAWNWYRDGSKFKKFNYVNGQPEGIQQAWRQNGKLFSNFEYKNGRIFGLRKSNTCIGLEDEVLSLSYYKKQSEGGLIDVQ